MCIGRDSLMCKLAVVAQVGWTPRWRRAFFRAEHDNVLGRGYRLAKTTNQTRRHRCGVLRERVASRRDPPPLLLALYPRPQAYLSRARAPTAPARSTPAPHVECTQGADDLGLGGDGFGVGAGVGAGEADGSGCEEERIMGDGCLTRMGEWGERVLGR